MATSIRFLGILALGFGLAVAATVQSAPPPQPNPAVAAIIDLSNHLDEPGVAEQARKIVKEQDSCDISTVFRPRKNGGAGIGSAVQAGHADSIQSLVQHWSGPKPPTKGELQAHRHDLLKVARVLKVMAELAPLRLALIVPKNDEKRVAAMHKVTGEFKTVTRDLHEAILKVEPMATRQAAVRLNQVCMNCHQVAGL